MGKTTQAMRQYQAKRGITSKSSASKRQRKGYDSVARTRGAAVVGEMKYYDAERTATAISAVGATWVAGNNVDPSSSINLGSAAVANPLCLVAPVTGSALNNRVGRKITVHKIKIHGYIIVAAQAAQSTSDAACKIRLVLVQNQQTNAAQTVPADLFNAATSADTTINSFQNPNNFGKFRVLKDKMFTISNLNMAGSPTSGDVITGSVRYNFKFMVNFKKPVVVHFNAVNGGTVADIVDNSFNMIAAADNTVYAPQIAYYSRVCYKDV